MNIESKLSEDNKVLFIGIRGKFNFNLLNEFRKSYSTTDPDPEKYVIDLGKTSEVDSSALGMLLNMQRYLKKADGEITLINCNPDVQRVFQITKFGEKFNIE